MMLIPLEQKYKSAYYCWVSRPGYPMEHYMMFMGIRTRHSTKEEVIDLCKKINAENNLPNITL